MIIPPIRTKHCIFGKLPRINLTFWNALTLQLIPFLLQNKQYKSPTPPSSKTPTQPLSSSLQQHHNPIPTPCHPKHPHTNPLNPPIPIPIPSPTHSPTPTPPSHHRHLPPSIHLLTTIPSITPPPLPPAPAPPIPIPIPPSPSPADRKARGFRPKGCGSVVWRCDCRAVRVRWVAGESGVRRERDPVVEVRRMDCEEVGEGEGRRVRVVGKEAVWKVERGRRRWPVWDLGSVVFFGAVSMSVCFDILGFGRVRGVVLGGIGEIVGCG